MLKPNKLANKNFLSSLDLKTDELLQILDLADQFKNYPWPSDEDVEDIRQGMEKEAISQAIEMQAIRQDFIQSTYETENAWIVEFIDEFNMEPDLKTCADEQSVTVFLENPGSMTKPVAVIDVRRSFEADDDAWWEVTPDKWLAGDRIGKLARNHPIN